MAQNSRQKRVIFISGVSSGLGKAMAGYLSERNFRVVGTSRNPKEDEKKYRVIPMDLDDPSTIGPAVQTVVDAEGGIDVLINNAGMGYAGAAENFSGEEMRRQMQINFFGHVSVIQAVLPHMRAAGQGKIINISSLGGLAGLPFQSFYSASKFALEGLSQSLAMELKPFNIQVALVNPGDFRTGFTSSRKCLPGDSRNMAYQNYFQKCFQQFEMDEAAGQDPVHLARTITRIVNTRSPKLHYLVGRLDQVLFFKLKKFIPEKLFYKILTSHYKIK